MKDIKVIPQPVILPIHKIAVSRLQAVCKVGNPLGHKYRYGDICIMWKGITGSKLYMNSTILKSALLNSKEFLMEELGLKVIDVNAEPDPNYVEPEIPKEPKPLEPEKVELVITKYGDYMDDGVPQAPEKVEPRTEEEVRESIENLNNEIELAKVKAENPMVTHAKEMGMKEEPVDLTEAAKEVAEGAEVINETYEEVVKEEIVKKVLEPDPVEEISEEEKKELVEKYMPEAKEENISDAPQSIEELPYAEIRAHAKNMGLDFKGNPKKEVLLKMIKGE